MDDRLLAIKDAMLSGRTGEMDEEMFKHTNRLKFAIALLLDYPHKHKHELVKMIQEEFLDDRPSNSACYKMLSDAEELFPSIEKVNRSFELARLIKMGYKLLAYAIEKRNIRDGASMIKQLRELVIEASGDEQQGDVITIINNIRYAPESLGVQLPDGFDLDKFINDLEKQYNGNTVEGTAEEV